MSSWRGPERASAAAWPVIVWTAAIWISAPLLPVLRAALNESRPGGFEWYVGAGLVASGAAAVLFAAARRRGHLLRTLGALALLAGVGAALYALLAAPDPRAHVVEVAHFVEYGGLGFLALRGARSAAGVLGSAVDGLAVVTAVGLVDESLQWVLPSRVAEARDLALNVVAGALGIAYATIVSRGAVSWTRTSRASTRRTVAHLLILVPALAGFLHAVHGAHRIRWSDTEFVSRFAPEELDRLAADRRESWASLGERERRRLTHPEERILAIEDFYVTEARYHIHYRNDAARGGDLRTAAAENRILERWFAPYLGIAGAHRLDLPEQGGDGVYRSPVFAHLWPWLDARLLWPLVVAVELGLLWTLFQLRDRERMR